MLENRLGPDYKCYVAMRYWHPFTDDAVQKAVADGCTSAVVLPLYPHFSISTTGTERRPFNTRVAPPPPATVNTSTFRDGVASMA